ncbi:MAG: sulfurtransferase [Acidimicrobiia bacterium]
MTPALVSPDWLEERLGDPSQVIVEVSFFRPETAAWFRGHIPDSKYVHWKDLCWDEKERRFPEPGEMADRLARLGASADRRLVLVGDTLQFATYAYWVATMCGLEDVVSVLDGGHRTWEEQRRPLTTDPSSSPPPGSLTPTTPDVSSLVGRDDVMAHIDDAARVLVDLRSEEEYRGDRVSPTTAPFDHGAERGGHIPGARHLYYERLLRADGTFRAPSELEAEFCSVGASPERDVVTYCRLSHRASLGWFALTRLSDREKVRVYDGSWTEWGSMVGMPVER